MRLLPTLVLSLAVFVNNAYGLVCPPNFDSVGSKCYHVVPGSVVSWYQAAEKCHSMGADVISFNSQVELDAIFKYMENKGSNPRVWTGLTSSAFGKWTWTSSGAGLAYEGWWGGGHSGGIGKCSFICRFDRRLWEITCNEAYGVICEKAHVFYG